MVRGPSSTMLPKSLTSPSSGSKIVRRNKQGRERKKEKKKRKCRPASRSSFTLISSLSIPLLLEKREMKGRAERRREGMEGGEKGKKKKVESAGRLAY